MPANLPSPSGAIRLSDAMRDATRAGQRAIEAIKLQRSRPSLLRAVLACIVASAILSGCGVFCGAGGGSGGGFAGGCATGIRF
jgi:hypothetical protein